MNFLIAALFLSLFGFSQTNLTTAVDFTENDLNGNPIHLFEILDAGQYVLIDFFYTTWSSCISTAPDIKQTYENYGCNNKDVFVVSVDDYNESVADCQAFDDEYGIVFPTINMGSSICNTYNITAFPTYILIAPDHSIIEQDMWPISSSTDFDNFIQPHGLIHKSCSTTDINFDDFVADISIYPNPAKENVNIKFNYTGDVTIKITNTLGEIIFEQNENTNGSFAKTLDLQGFANGIYFVTIQTNEGIYTEKLKIQ